MGMIHCVLLDTEPASRSFLIQYLSQYAMEVEGLADGSSFRQRLSSCNMDVLVLDISRPKENGLGHCLWARQQCPAMPIILLSNDSDPMSRVLGLEMGADDYLSKPFAPRELLARIRAQLRRDRAIVAALQAPACSLKFAGCTFDRMRRQLQAADGSLTPLSGVEYRLLCVFVEHPGKVLSRERLLTLIHSADDEAGGRRVDLAVSRLRSKMAGKAGPGVPSLIRTLRGEGYLFDAKVES